VLFSATGVLGLPLLFSFSRSRFNSIWSLSAPFPHISG
jgi:hypothetical protein